MSTYEYQIKCIDIIDDQFVVWQQQTVETSHWTAFLIVSSIIFNSFLNYFQFIFWWGKKLKAIFIMRSFFSTSYICVLAENSCVKSSPVCPSSFIEKPLRLTHFLVWFPGSKIFLTPQIWWQMKIKKDQFLISAAVVLLQKLPLWWWKNNNKRIQG